MDVLRQMARTKRSTPTINPMVAIINPTNTTNASNPHNIYKIFEFVYQNFKIVDKFGITSVVLGEFNLILQLTSHGPY